MKISLSIACITSTLLFLTGCASKAERQFVSGCQSTGMERSACKCAYKKLESKYGEEGLKNQLYTMRPSDSFQYDMMQSGLQCMKE